MKKRNKDRAALTEKYVCHMGSFQHLFNDFLSFSNLFNNIEITASESDGWTEALLQVFSVKHQEKVNQFQQMNLRQMSWSFEALRRSEVTL